MLEFLRLAPLASLIFLITLITSLQAFRDPALKARFMLHPWDFVREKKYYQIFTSGIIHGDFIHLAMNMIAFWYFAFFLEKVMTMEQVFQLGDNHGLPEWMPQAIGHMKFLILYIASLVVSDLTTILKYKDSPSYSSLGASGAISGVVIAAIVFRPTGLQVWGLPGWLFAILFLFGSYFLAQRKSDNINHEAHMWGGIAGFVFTLLLYPHLTKVLWGQVSELF